MPWHPRHDDEAWIAETEKRIGATDAEHEWYSANEPLDAYDHARDMGADETAQREVDDLLEEEMRSYRRDFKNAIQDSGDKELQALVRASERMENSMYNITESYNDVLIRNGHEDMIDPGWESHGDTVPVPPDIVRNSPDEAKKQLKSHLNGLIDDIREREEYVMNAWGIDEDEWDSNLPDELRSGDNLDDWLKRTFRLGDDHLPNFGSGTGQGCEGVQSADAHQVRGPSRGEGQPAGRRVNEGIWLQRQVLDCCIQPFHELLLLQSSNRHT